MLNRLSNKARALIEVLVGVAVVSGFSVFAVHSVYAPIIEFIFNLVLIGALIYMLYDFRKMSLDYSNK